MIATLQGARLLLAPMNADDTCIYAGLYGDPATMRWVGAPLTAAAAQRSAAAALRANAGEPWRRRTWILVERSSADRIGLAALVRSDIVADAASAEVGVVLRPPAQNRGHAAEVIRLLATHAFTQLGIARLHTRHSRENHAAAVLMRKLAFQPLPDGDEPQPCRWHLLRPQ